MADGGCRLSVSRGIKKFRQPPTAHSHPKKERHPGKGAPHYDSETD